MNNKQCLSVFCITCITASLIYVALQDWTKPCYFLLWAVMAEIRINSLNKR